ncbi:hypothetical protein MKW92_018301 [Papaver armeniacum]|nr:hypothetical protein MKW92_018301 [Papaver armeniacum]
MILSPESRSVNESSSMNSNMGPSQAFINQHDITSLQGPVAILWDIENCLVPSDVRPEDVDGNIRMALRVHPIIQGDVTLFSVYGDFNAFPRRLREGCQRTGVKLVDVPNGRKDAADKAILVDMFLFALDNPPPSLIFSNIYQPNVLLLEEFTIFIRTHTNNLDLYGLLTSRSISLPSGLNDVPAMPANLVKLLDLSGGCPPLVRVPAEYNKTFGRPLYVAEYGVMKLVNLLKKMADAIANGGHEKVENGNSSAVFPKKDKRGKGCQEETVDINVCTIPGCSSDEFPDDDKGAVAGLTSNSNDRLKQFKQEMQELLVSCSCKIHLEIFEEMYKQRYKKNLHYQSFGVNNLEELINKVRDDVNLYQEQESKRKFVVPNFASG